jgi:6-phosphogluconate dehydrogenase
MAKTIAKASKEQKWNVKLSDCMKIWRAGCIIQSGRFSSICTSSRHGSEAP